jgi:thioester reductase-like protein
VDLPLRTLFAGPTVAALATAIVDLQQGPSATALPVMTRAELAAEAVLAPEVRPAGAGPAAPPAEPVLFLTGASGFLGAFLLHEILRQLPAARVCCLVRAADAAQGLRKLAARLTAFGLWDESAASRIQAIPGDLARPRLGLAGPEFQRLAEEVDAVYHNGAWVNLFYAYSTLEPTNVLGTHEVLRLAALARPKPVHYVSTTGVFFSAGGPPLEAVDEETDLGAVAGLLGGYAQSKWVAEKLVRLAGERGVPVTVYRPGRIGGHSATGLGNADDLLFRILAGSLQLGAAPELEMEVELSPVDYVSRALVHLSRQPGSAGQTYHLVNPRLVPWGELLRWIDGLDRPPRPPCPLRRLPWADWQAELRRSAERSADNVLYPLLPVLAAEPGEADAEAREPRIACARTREALAGSGIVCPPLDAALLRHYLDHLQPTRKETT